MDDEQLIPGETYVLTMGFPIEIPDWVIGHIEALLRTLGLSVESISVSGTGLTIRFWA